MSPKQPFRSARAGHASRCLSSLWLVVLCFPNPTPAQSRFDQDLDRALESFFAAAYDGEDRHVDAAIDRVLDLEPSHAVLTERLRRGRAYRPVEPGIYEATHEIDGVEHHFAWVVPQGYDAKTPIAVQFMLHGGISREDRRAGGQGPIENLVRAPHVTVLPSGWRDSKWWHESQVKNLRAILDKLKGELNLDENRVGLAGISDGATGVYYFAMLDPTPWAYFMAFIGNLRVLASVDVEGELYPSNLRNRSFLSINTDGDRLYPFDRVASTLERLIEAGVDIDLVEQKDFGHDTRWWGLQIRHINAFADAHPRAASPTRLSWATSAPQRWGRLHGLEIVELGNARGEATLPETAIVNGLFGGSASPGRVDLERDGNRWKARTRGVTRFRIWLEVGEVDFSTPVAVEINGNAAFEEIVPRDHRFLLERFAVDLDRTRLSAAVLELSLPTDR